MVKLTPPVGAADHAQGPADARVTLVEYGDYECPYCGEAYPVLKAVQRAMGDRLRFVFRNFPIPQSHPHALQAARFAEAAASVGRFWEAHDMLYENQGALDDASLAAYGEAIGLSPAVLDQAFNGLHDPKIEGDFRSGLHSGVNGTPTLFINGARHDGPRDVESLVERLTAALRVRA